MSLKISEHLPHEKSASMTQTPAERAIRLQGRLPEGPIREDYIYSQLPPRSLRLLRFVSNRLSDGIECDLAIFSLSQPPRYNALSYCWGDDSRTSSLLCNRKGMIITPGLEEALDRLVTLDRGGVEWIWIDQICINQLDAQERSSQVNMMKDIYQRSEGTIIWLGPDIPGINVTTGLMEKMSFLHDKDVDFYRYRKRKLYSEQDFSATGLPPPQDPVWNAFRQLLSREWFVRAWIIQEAILSKITPRMLCGSHELAWEKLIGSATWLILMCYTLVPQLIDEDVWPAMRSLNLFNDLKFLSPPWELATLLKRTRMFKASEARDRVYSLFGLAGETQDTSNVPLLLQANYEKPVSDVFRDMTRYIIMSSTNLGILGLALHSSDWQKFPSWVCNFASNTECEAISQPRWARHTEGWQYLQEIHNHASGDIPVELGMSSSYDILALNGIQIDLVKTPYETMWNGSLFGHEAQALAVWKKACQEPRNRYFTIEEFARVFMITLVANAVLGEKERAMNMPMSPFWSYMWKIYNKLHNQATSIKASADLEREYGNIILSPDASDSDIYLECLNVAHTRRVFFTQNSSYFGLGPGHMQENDILCVIFGGATPIILRPDGEHYRFIGECYVHDLMNGEAIKAWHDGVYTVKTFHLI